MITNCKKKFNNVFAILSPSFPQTHRGLVNCELRVFALYDEQGPSEAEKSAREKKNMVVEKKGYREMCVQYSTVQYACAVST